MKGLWVARREDGSSYSMVNVLSVELYRYQKRLVSSGEYVVSISVKGYATCRVVGGDVPKMGTVYEPVPSLVVGPLLDTLFTRQVYTKTENMGEYLLTFGTNLLLDSDELWESYGVSIVPAPKVGYRRSGT